jgi:hypothetical protein
LRFCLGWSKPCSERPFSVRRRFPVALGCPIPVSRESCSSLNTLSVSCVRELVFGISCKRHCSSLLEFRSSSPPLDLSFSVRLPRASVPRRSRFPALRSFPGLGLGPGFGSAPLTSFPARGFLCLDFGCRSRFRFRAPDFVSRSWISLPRFWFPLKISFHRWIEPFTCRRLSPRRFFVAPHPILFPDRS